MANIPPRPEGAMTGEQIRQRLVEIMGDTQSCTAQELERRRAQVEEFVFQQFSSGNVPDFMRPENYRAVTSEVRVGDHTVTATIRVCPDYLAIGGNGDFVRVPLDAITAQRIADRFSLALPTQRLVDIIDANATQAGGMLPFVAAPQIAKRIRDPHNGNKPVESKWNYQQYGNYEGRWMLSGEFIAMQNQMIQENPEAMRNAPIRSGQKKDVIYDPLAFKESKEGGPPVVIYRKGVQGLSNWHNEGYFDYSHGIRFIDPSIQITVRYDNGSSVTHPPMSMRDVLLHSEFYRLLAPVKMDINKMYHRTSQAIPQRTGQAVQPPPVHEEPTRRRREPQALA